MLTFHVGQSRNRAYFFSFLYKMKDPARTNRTMKTTTNTGPTGLEFMPLGAMAHR